MHSQALILTKVHANAFFSAFMEQRKHGFVQVGTK